MNVLNTPSMPPSPLELLNEVIASYNDRNFEEALMQGNKIINLHPLYHPIHNILGTINSILGHHEQAVYHLRQAIKLEPNHAHAYNNLGVTLKNLFKYDEAQQMIEKAIKIKPDNAQAYKNLGDIFRKKNLNDLAIQNYKTSIQINPSCFEAVKNLGATLQELTRFDEALSCFESFLTLDPSCADAMYYSALIFFEIGQYSQAFDFIKKGLLIKPDDEQFMQIYAKGLASMGEVIPSITVLKKIIRLNSNNSNIITDLVKLSSYDTKLNPKKLFKNFCKVMNCDQNIPERCEENPCQEIIALMGFGRAGALFFHSLIDGNPNVLTLPGYFFKGWFGENVWELIAPNTRESNWKKILADKICDNFEPQFNANSKRNVIGNPQGHTNWLANGLGFTKMGPNHSNVLVLDQTDFKQQFVELLKSYDSIDQKSCFELIHKAFNIAYRKTPILKQSTIPPIFYHLHNPDYFEQANFFSQYPEAKVLYIMRHPIQMLESWLAEEYAHFQNSSYVNHHSILYHSIVDRIISSLNFSYNPFNDLTHTRGVKIEDIKRKSVENLPIIAAWLGISDHPSLYKSEFLNKQYSRPSASFDQITGFDTRSIDVPPGRIFGERDIIILETLFWPILEIYKYTNITRNQFTKKLKTIRPWLDEPFQFEDYIQAETSKNNFSLKSSESHASFHKHLINAWETLSNTGTYPHLIKPLVL